LGRLIPPADCVVVADGSVEAMYDRCREISSDEVARQLSAWRALAPVVGKRVVTCDTTADSPDACADAVIAALLSLERRKHRWVGAERQRWKERDSRVPLSRPTEHGVARAIMGHPRTGR